MKKIFLLIIIILLLGGCSNNKEAGNNPSNVPDNGVTDNANDDLSFEHNGVVVKMNSKAEEIINALGEPVDYFESESCAFQGLDKIYTYNGFVIYTYPIDGVDFISSVILTDDSVSTGKGIKITSALDDVLKAYGDDYTERFDVYTYSKDKATLSFMIENNEVVSIEYVAITTQTP